MEDNIVNVTAVVDGRYLLAEYQDHLGNVYYFHTDPRVVWMPDGTSLYAYLTAPVTDEQINSIFTD